MIKKLIMAGGVLGLIWMVGCLDKIDFERPDTIENGIAIQGRLIKGEPSVISVTIRKIFDFSETARLINAREVILINENNQELDLMSNADGIYFLEIPSDNPNFDLDYGTSYKLKVNTFDNRTYESTLERLYPVPELEKLEVRKASIESVNAIGQLVSTEVLDFVVSTSLTPEGFSEKAQVLWELESVHKLTDSPNSYGGFSCRPTLIDEEEKTCYITSSPVANYVVLDGTTFSGERVDEYSIFQSTFNTNFAEGYYLNVFQQSLSPTAYNYWAQVNSVVNRTGDIFEAPAGKVVTNFKNIENPDDEVYGYFYVTEQREGRVYVSPELANNPTRRCPAVVPAGGTPPSDCCNCLSLTGRSTIQRPIWWVE